MPYLLEHAHAIRADRGGQSFISVDNGVIEVGETQHGCRMDRGGFQDRQTDPALGTRHMIVDQSVGDRSLGGLIGSMCRPRNEIRYLLPLYLPGRSEGRRGGTECVSTCISR